MQCPFCKSVQTKCIDSRPVFSIRKRRYICLDCKERFNTIEKWKPDAKKTAPVIAGKGIDI